jgi:hypothetical protein
MNRLRVKLATSGLVSVAIMLITATAADARLATNHNETLVRDER